jgi:hypothetical protein
LSSEKKQLPTTVETTFMSPSVSGQVDVNKNDVVKYLVAREHDVTRRKLKKMKTAYNKINKAVSELDAKIQLEAVEAAKQQYQEDLGAIQAVLGKFHIDADIQIHFLDLGSVTRSYPKGKKTKAPVDKVHYTATLQFHADNVASNYHGHSGVGFYLVDDAHIKRLERAAKANKGNKPKRVSKDERLTLELTLPTAISTKIIQIQGLMKERDALLKQIEDLEVFLSQPHEVEQHLHAKLVEGMLSKTQGGQEILAALNNLSGSEGADNETIASFNVRRVEEDDED